jgi:chromosome segregation protein
MNIKKARQFLLLDKVNAGVVNVDVHQPEGTIPAMDVIEVDEQFRELARNLLGNVFIA